MKQDYLDICHLFSIEGVWEPIGMSEEKPVAILQILELKNI